jgi:flagellar biosynthesis chaperone FliJ
MQSEKKELSVLLDQYNQQIDTLKSKLLNGVSWEDLQTLRRSITQLGIAIQKTYDYKLPADMRLLKQNSYQKNRE